MDFDKEKERKRFLSELKRHSNVLPDDERRRLIPLQEQAASLYVEIRQTELEVEEQGRFVEVKNAGQHFIKINPGRNEIVKLRRLLVNTLTNIEQLTIKHLQKNGGEAESSSLILEELERNIRKMEGKR